MMRVLLSCLLALVLVSSHVASATQAAETSEATVTFDINEAPSFSYPQRRTLDGYSLVLHAPQIRSWPEFESFDAVIAVELLPTDGAAPIYGTAQLSGKTEVLLDRRIVVVRSPDFTGAEFPGQARAAEYAQLVNDAATRKELEIPLDTFFAYLADEVLESPPPPGFNVDPPSIRVATKPTILLFVNGNPVYANIDDTGLEVVANSNWPTFRDSGKGDFYLYQGDVWLTAEKLQSSKWKAAKSLPAGFEQIPADSEHSAIRLLVPIKPGAGPAPAVVYVSQPTELIVTEGKPELEVIPETEGLNWVRNTTSPLFKLDKDWYFLVAGRWFTTTNLNKGPWAFTSDLPDGFAKIPESHAQAAVRASVRGTTEARMAALEASLPVKIEASRDAAAPVDVTYAGEPQFEPVQGTGVARAVNTGYDILEVGGRYYLCYAGIWYVADKPVGPWTVTGDVPAAVYTIPPSSPAYNVTQVQVAQSTPSTVYYSYPPSYSTSVYVVYGTPYYGTGWYYPPYIYGGYYYPYYGSYGHGSWYNPATGGYGSRSVWYGPYGGYSYAQGYNPRTGSLGYVETAWDGDEWYSHGEKYNARTGTYSETDREYDEDKNKLKTEREAQRGDTTVSTERRIDFDDQTSSVQRESSQGGSSQVNRSLNDGTLSSSGTATTKTGETLTLSGEQTRSGGSSTLSSSDGRSATIDTERQGGSSISTIEGSGGGQAKSISGQGPGRTTIGESGSGDLYAGHNGNVFKKTDDGWNHYQDGGWQQVDTPERPDGAPTANATRSEGVSADRAQQIQSNDFSRELSEARAQAQQRSSGAAAGGSRDYSQLNRDFQARQRGSQQFSQRSSYQQRGGFQSQRGSRSGGMQRSGGGRRR